MLLERTVNIQRESDVYATRAMRHIHTNLATVVYETGQLKGRISTIADYQKQHQGSVMDVAERMREYTHMLEQAQGTIQSLQEPSVSPRDDLLLMRTYSSSDEEEEEEEFEDDKKTNSSCSSVNNLDLYRHRIIKKRASSPEVAATTKRQNWLPQEGLRILLNDYRGF